MGDDNTRLKRLHDLRQAQSHQAKEDPLGLIYVLQLQRIELELQNQELRETRELLEQSHARYLDLYDCAPTAQLSLTDKGVIEQANLASVALFGKRRAEDLVGKPLIAVARMVDSRPFFQHLAACLATGTTVTSELSVRLAKAERTLQITSTPVWQDGFVAGCRASIVDISQRKRDEAAVFAARTSAETAYRRLSLLGKLSAMFAAALPRAAELTEVAQLLIPELGDGCIIDLVRAGESGGTGVAWADPRGLAEAERLAEAGVLSRRGGTTPVPELHELTDDAQLRRLADSPEDLAQLRALGASSCVMAPISARNRILGALALFSSSPSRRFGPPDLELARELGQRLGMFLDHTRAHAQLEAASRTRDEVLHVVTHDIQNALAAISLHASTVQTSITTGPPGARTSMIAIERAAAMSQRLVTDLLDLAATDSRRLTLSLTHANPDELIRQAISILEPLARPKGVELRTAVATPLPDVSCDEDRITQVMLNILGNALKLTPEGGTILVAAQIEGPMLKVCITDTGPGVPSPHRDRIFDKFWRSGPRAGFGLGLFIAKNIIEAHGGRLWLADTSGGAQFCFTLPTLDEPLKPSRGNAAAAAGRSG